MRSDELEIENEQLGKEIRDLKVKYEARIEQLEKENRELKQALEKQQQEAASLHEDEVEILRLLAESGEMTAYQINSQIDVKPARIDYYIERLINGGFIHFSIGISVPGQDATYWVSQKGREYLVKKGLI